MKTVKMPVTQLEPDMVVAEDIYTFSNQLIIQQGTHLTDKIITRLKFYSIQTVRLCVDDNTPEPIPVQPYATEFYQENLKQSTEFKEFNHAHLEMAGHLKEIMHDLIEATDEANVSLLYHEINRVVSKSRNGLHVLEMLHCMRGYDDLTYIHSINVALICRVLGTWLNFSDKDLETLTICGLLHDIGKVTIPYEIISKPSSLTDEEFSTMKAHSLRGYNILRPQKVNIHIKMSAMMHHERCDGSGYPLGLQGNQIDSYAKIVMIADVYDAMTSARVYRGPLCPFEVLSVFEKEGLTKYDPKYIMTFFDNITMLYQNCSVRLSDGSTGKIVLMHRNNLTRPIICVGSNFINLSDNDDLFITEVL